MMREISSFFFEEKNIGLVLGVVILGIIAITIVFVLEIEDLVTENLHLKNEILNFEHQPKLQPFPPSFSPDSLRGRWMYWYDDDFGPR